MPMTKSLTRRRRRVEAKNREEEARIWISGVEAVKAKIGVKAVYDLSATPFFLRGSGLPEGTPLPVGRFRFFAHLIDAIESVCIVKVLGRRAGRRRFGDRGPAHLPATCGALSGDGPPQQGAENRIGQRAS